MILKLPWHNEPCTSNGQALVVEPPFHVSKSAFLKTISKAQDAGLKPDEGPRVILSKAVILKKGNI